MELALLTQLTLLKLNNSRPNFSELARMYGCDRKTIKKYMEWDEIKAKTCLECRYHLF